MNVPQAELARRLDPDAHPPVPRQLRHMELSLSDLERILDPASRTSEEEARRQRTLARVRWLGELTHQRLEQGVSVDLEEMKRVHP